MDDVERAIDRSAARKAAQRLSQKNLGRYQKQCHRQASPEVQAISEESEGDTSEPGKPDPGGLNVTGHIGKEKNTVSSGLVDNALDFYFSTWQKEALILAQGEVGKQGSDLFLDGAILI